MPGNYHLPTDKEVSAMLADLIGKDAPTKTSAAWTPPAGGPLTVATYTNNAGELGAVCICDLSVGGSIGAILTRIPASLVNEGIKAGKLADNLMENLKEVLNIFSSIINKSPHPHLALKEVLSVPPALPDAVNAIVSKPVTRLDLEVSVPGYNKGLISFFAGSYK
ncbi:hypothetical protein K1X76_05380 [bacterium]|nr:hypothetical protein [bacterium]